ncbi:MAG: response regulator [Candidatus Delongbacteria bacterium]|nr:response regulator [Candidatus Delongbacteria bacterium]
MQEDKFLNRILIVDDELNFLETLHDLLEVSGFEVKTASNPIDGLKVLKRENIKLVISDLRMTPISGIEFLKQIKEYNPDIEVILLTAFTDLQLLLQALQEGASDFLTKPAEFSDVKAAVKKIQIKLSKTLQLKTYYKKIEQQNFEMIKYKTLLEKRAQELEDAYTKISDLNYRLKQKVDDQTKELTNKEIAASYGELMQGIIHNLNTPLSTINGGLDLLRMIISRDMKAEALQPEAYIDRIDRIVGSTKNLRSIIKNMLNRSRLENLAELKVFDLNKIIDQELEFLNADMFFKHKVTKNIMLCETPCNIKVIYSDISQILINIIKNALDAMWNVPKKLLSIFTEDRGDIIILKISDTGSGISEENKNKIFNMFFTTKPTLEKIVSREQPVGNGIGLHTVKELASRYNISIDVESELNVGTSFILTFKKFLEEPRSITENIEHNSRL